MENSIAELLQLYQSTKRTIGLSNTTVDRVVLNVEMLCADMNVTSSEQLTTAVVLGWGERKLAQGISQSTLYTYFNSIRSFLVFLERHNIPHYVDRPTVRCRPQYKNRVWLRPGEIRHIVRCASPTVAILIRLMYTAGLRLSEAVSITGAHLYEGTTMYVTGKGGKVRPVFVTKQLHADLQTLATVNGGFCFVDKDGNQLSRTKAYYYVKQAMTRAGYGHAYPHSLRHSFCTELLRKGVSLAHASRLMGHSSVAITQIYEHLLTDDIEKAHALLTKV